MEGVSEIYLDKKRENLYIYVKKYIIIAVVKFQTLRLYRVTVAEKTAVAFLCLYKICPNIFSMPKTSGKLPVLFFCHKIPGQAYI